MHSQPLRQGEPRWPAMVALLSVSALFYALPPALKVGPDWLFVVLVAALTAPGVFFHQMRRRPLVRVLYDSGNDRFPVVARLAPAAP